MNLKNLIYQLVTVMACYAFPVDSVKCNAKSQRIRNNGLDNICCFTKKCGYNQNFVPCAHHNSSDVCVTCPRGKCYDNKINTADFADTPDSLCAIIEDQCDEEQGADPVYTAGSCMPHCECRVKDGYFQFDKDLHGCSHTILKCDTPGKQLSNVTGKCVTCPDHQFKKEQDGFCVDKKRVCPEGEVIIDQGSSIKDIECGAPGSNTAVPEDKNSITPTVSSDFNETTTRSAGGKDSFVGKIIGSVTGICVISALLFFLIRIICKRRNRKNKKKKTKGDIEKNPEGSVADSTVSCDSCGKTLLTCTYTGSQQAHSEEIVFVEVEPDSDVGPSSNLLTSTPSTPSEQGSQANGVDVQTSTHKKVGETKEETASKTQYNIRPESLNDSDDQIVTNMETLRGLFSSEDPQTFDFKREDSPVRLDNEGNSSKERDKHVNQDPRMSEISRRPVATVKGMPKQEDRLDNSRVEQRVNNDAGRIVISGHASMESRQVDDIQHASDASTTGSGTGGAGGGTSVGTGGGTGSGTPGVTDDMSVMSQPGFLRLDVGSLVDNSQDGDEQSDENCDEDTSLMKQE